MRTPSGLPPDSTRTPDASRAGALHSHIHRHIHSQNLLLTFANADTREALATAPPPVAAGLRDAGQAMTRWLG